MAKVHARQVMHICILRACSPTCSRAATWTTNDHETTMSHYVAQGHAHTPPKWRPTLNRCYPELILPLGTGPGPKELCSADENILPSSATPTPCPRQHGHIPLMGGRLLEEGSEEVGQGM